MMDVKGRILLVDDELPVLRALARILKDQPFEILAAPSAKCGLEILAARPVDLVISDERMPEMTGTQFLSIVHRRFPDTVRIILTGYADLDSCLQAINECEVYRFLTKPWNNSDLLATVHQALRHKELIQHARRLLETVKKQNSLLGTTPPPAPNVEETRRNAAIIDLDGVEHDHESLIREISLEIAKAESRAKKSDRMGRAA